MRPVTRVIAPVRTQVRDILKSMITDGQLSPGDRLIERDLCEQFGVSRPLLREALRQLEAEGLVSSLPNGGVHVKMMNLEEASEIYAVRAFLEAGAARLIAEAGSDEVIEELERYTKLVEEALATGDPLEFRRAKNNFYKALQNGCGNATLSEMLGMVHGRIQLLRTFTLGDPPRRSAAVAEIRAIVDAIRRRDPEEAHRLSVLHMDNACATMREVWKKLHGDVAMIA